MTREEIKKVLNYNKVFLKEYFSNRYYEHMCRAFEDINEKLAFLDGLLTIIKGDLTDIEYNFVINEYKKLAKELERQEKKWVR